MKKHQPFIIILDGIDGSGKTVLTQSVEKYLNDNASKVYRGQNLINVVNTFSFPTYHSLTGFIIKTLLNKDLDEDLRKVLAATFALDRQISYHGNADFENDILIINRYYPSNFAYNYMLDIDWLVNLEVSSFVGDAVFILDIPPEVSLERRPERRDNYEKDLQYLSTVRNKYLELAGKFGWTVLDGRKDTITLTFQVINHCANMNRGLDIIGPISVES